MTTPFDGPAETACRDAAWRALPRLLSGFDRDETSQLYGCGDRYHWAWKLIDFPNATFQGAAAGLARLAATNLLPTWLPRKSALARVDAIFEGARAVTGRDGGLAEAFPNEGSFCVTGLVAADLMQAIENLAPWLGQSDRQRYLDTVAPMIAFLQRRDEDHAIISNHLATSALALFAWSDVTGDDVDARGRDLVERILTHQSGEGWYREYEGADPGYQSWCTAPMARIHRRRPDLGLGDSLRRSLQFLWHFAHPDGSFGGVYGSRMARFIFPSGFELLADEIPEAATLAAFARESIAGGRCVTLDAIDPPSLAPLFNDYAFAASWAASGRDPADESPGLPSRGAPFRRHFPQAGLLVDRGAQHHTVIATSKGGALHHVAEEGAVWQDPGFVGRDLRGRLVTSQIQDPSAVLSVDEAALVVEAPLRRVSRPLPDAKRFIVLRLLCLTVFRFPRAGALVKRLLARYLVTGRSRPVGQVRRTITFGPEPKIVDEVIAGRAEPLTDVSHFSAIHMASQGYWQRSDDES